MPLFQTPPQTPEEVRRARPLDVSPEQVLEMDEATWYAQIYRGDDVPQLTIRAVLMGTVLGFLLAFTNLYVGLKTGWGLGVAITASILSYGIWNVLQAVGLAKTPMTILETNCMQSTASSAGYSTGSTMVSAVPALLMLSASAQDPGGEHLKWWVLGGWTFFVGILGTVLAIPMKRNMINRERLKFPSGTAAAVTLQSLYSAGESALRKARALAATAVLGAFVPLVLDLNVRKTEGGRAPLLPAATPIFDGWLPARGTHDENGVMVPNKPSDWNMVLEHNPLLMAAGAIMGLRICVWMAIGGLLLNYVVGPYGAEQAWTSPLTQKVRLATSHPALAWKEIGLWLGVSMMVTSSLLQFGLQWRTIVRAIRGFSGGPAIGDDPRIAATEVPTSWFVIGTIVGGAGTIAIAATSFGIPVYYGVLAVFLTFLLALVACRATGESDVTPIGAMGKLMQLSYGVLIPQSTTANLMTASITSNCAASSADLLNDLKSGYLLGANPRRQFVAQLSGVLTGTIATVGGFYLLVPDAMTLNGSATAPPVFAAPAAQSWKAVAEVFKYGLGNMHPVHQQAMLVGGTIGIVLVLLEVVLPKAREWLPSATGLSLGFILPFANPFSMLIGGFLGWVWTRRSPATAGEYLIPVASGIIAGVSILGVVVAFLNNVVLT